MSPQLVVSSGSSKACRIDDDGNKQVMYSNRMNQNHVQLGCEWSICQAEISDKI
jgi:hypothetical protein